MSVYETVTNQILEELEKGTAPWVKPWTTPYPHNAVSQKDYRGVNVFLLLTTAMQKGYRNPAWLTFRQAKDLGGTVRKGEHGTQIVYAASYEKKGDNGREGDDAEPETIHFLKFYYVFNVEQTEGLPQRLTVVSTQKTIEESLPHARDFVEKIGATTIHGGNRACYIPSLDEIHLPSMEDFETEAHYYATRLHEEGHWTGHPCRLNRVLTGRFGDQSYAAEELIAELTAAYLCAWLEIPGQLRHAEYIGFWVKLLKDDKKAIFTAAARATEAADYLRSLGE